MTFTKRSIAARTACAAFAFWLAGSALAAAEIRITVSRFENGTLTVVGTTAPRQTVVLDGRARVTSDINGHFTFTEHYKPDTCMSDIVSGKDIYSAVIAGCYGEFAIEHEQPGVKAH